MLFFLPQHHFSKCEASGRPAGFEAHAVGNPERVCQRKWERRGLAVGNGRTARVPGCVWGPWHKIGVGSQVAEKRKK